MIEDNRAQVSLRLEHVEARLGATDPLLAEFVRLWWSRAPKDDLLSRSPEDDAAATIDSWQFFRQRDPRSTSIRIVNPTQAKDGWQSRHTVVRIVAPDMPFVMDSVLMALSHDGLVTHHFSNVVFATRRDTEGRIEGLSAARDWPVREDFIYAEIDRITSTRIEELEERLERALADVRAAVSDFAAMRAQLAALIESLRTAPPPLPEDELHESLAFLDWLQHNNFTMLGYRGFDYGDETIRQVPGSSLGILRNRRPATPRPLGEQNERVRDFLLEPRLLTFSQSGTRARVHRPAYPDYIGVRRFDATGKVVGEDGFLGLYTARVYVERPDRIPLIRRKVATVLERSGLDPAGFDGKVLNQVLATYPKAQLFQTTEEELLRNALNITYIHERKRTRFFVRQDPYGLFVHCLVYMPRDLYNTQVRRRIVEILCEAYAAEDAEFEPYFSESVLVRLQVTLRKRPDVQCLVDEQALTLRLLEVTRDWNADFLDELVLQFGESTSRHLGQDYALAFPAGYRERYHVQTAVQDLRFVEALTPDAPLRSYFYRRPEEPREILHLKIFHLGGALPLSDVTPTLENLGLRISAEHPYAIERASHPPVSLHDFDLVYPRALDIEEIDAPFTEAFERIWSGQVDDDRYNRLLLAAALDWRQINVLRTYVRYLKQVGLGFGTEFTGDTLCRYPAIAAGLVRYFELRFDPACDDPSAADRQYDELIAAFDGVALLNEDLVLRRILGVMRATVRTNYFRRDPDTGAFRPMLAFKLLPATLADLPKPVPTYEIFVASPRMEGVHLRSGPIARGGLRWSDRIEDYRTEILGLLKAQNVKNAVIVPTGAKGGFVVRHPAEDVDQLRRQGSECYEEFVSGLLDLTDNVVEGRVQHPPDVRCHDGEDSYLVVAADKGTATFSDLANAIAARYGFWLGDAFASGGSNGYDHKAMGITARGAWISVQRHFSERGVDVQSDRIRVLGIGDMSGDVFGNGLLRSTSVQLVAAFDHRHIFVDPDPDPDASFAERERLFRLPRSSWADYDRALLSQGGGVFDRHAKSIPITPEMQSAFDIRASRLAPDELINRLLRAPVDLIWNGGIGTYVKAAAESHTDVGDRANDSVRVDAEQLRCRVFGEGGNLGMTQSARVAFALAGGAVNSDFIDNSAGVDCSDHEVNIKIALNQLVTDGELTTKHRNQLLREMGDEVAALVLVNNFRQTRLLSLAARHVPDYRTEYQRFIALMEADDHLDRVLMGLPTDEQMVERTGSAAALTRPELAVLMAFAKIHIKRALDASSIAEDPLIRRKVFAPFPAVLEARFPEALLQHRLAREIVSNELANDIVHHMGITFVTHLTEFVGATVEEVVRAWLAAAGIFQIREQFRQIEAIAGVAEETRLAALGELIRLGRRSVRWLLRHERPGLDIAQLTARYASAVATIAKHDQALLDEPAHQERQHQIAELVATGIDQQDAETLSPFANLAIALTVAAAATRCGATPATLLETYTALGRSLEIDWLLERLADLPHDSHWQAMERDALIDDMVMEQTRLAARVHATGGALDAWLAARPTFRSAWQQAIDDARQANVADFALFAVTCRKLLSLGSSA